MKKRLIAILFLVLLAGCDDSNILGGQVAELRVLHASPDAPGSDVLVDSLLAFSGLTFGQTSGYITLDEGQRRIRVSQTGSAVPYIDVRYQLLDGRYYTFVIADHVASIKALLLEDEDVDPEFNKFKIRFLQAAPGAPAVDFYLAEQDANISQLEPRAADIPFTGLTPYYGLGSGKYRIVITRPGSKHPLIDTGPVPFDARQIRTVVALDAPGGGPPFRAIILVDRDT